MSETLGHAQQIAQKEMVEARWAQIELQMAAWSERAGQQLERMPTLEHERAYVHQRVMERER